LTQRTSVCVRLAAFVGFLITTPILAQPPVELPISKKDIKASAGVEASLPPGTILLKDETPIDLTTALRLAGAQNPELMFARERVTEAAAVQQLAAAQLLPNINLGFNYNLHRGPLQQANGNILTVNRDAFNIGLGVNAVGAGTVNIPGLNYNLNIGTAWFDILQTRQLVAGRLAAAKAVENDTLLRVCLAYTDLLRAEGRRAIALQNRDEGVEIARLTAAYAKSGQGRQADADRAAVELRRRDLDLTQAEADILTASARLCRLLNLDPSTRLKPIDGWVVPAPIVPDPVPLSELLAIALMQRPELGERRADIQGSIYSLANAKVLPFAPNVILGFSNSAFGGGSDLVSRPQGFIGGDGRVQQGPRFGNFDGRTDLDVVVFWQFRNLGVGNTALVKAAESRLRQTQLREMETINQVRAEVAEAHARVKARFIQIDTTEKAVRSSSDAYREDLTRIKGGQGLPLEVVDSLRLLARSRYEYLDTILDYNRAQFQLFVALGQPPANSLARPIPAELVPAPATTLPIGPRLLNPGRLSLPRPMTDPGK
jgi:outer membrane protein TolC